MKTDSVMLGLIVALCVFCAFLWGYNIGSAKDMKPDYMEYVKANDSGCDEIAVNNIGGLYCAISMQEEDDALFIIKKQGSKDDY